MNTPKQPVAAKRKFIAILIVIAIIVIPIYLVNKGIEDALDAPGPKTLQQISTPSVANASPQQYYHILSADLDTTGRIFMSHLNIVAVIDYSQASDDDKKIYLLNIYHDAQNSKDVKDIYSNVAYNILLYSSDNKANTDKLSYDAELTENPSFKDTAAIIEMGLSKGTQNDYVSQQEFKQAKLQFENHGVNYCNFYAQVNDWINQSNEKEDAENAKHPEKMQNNITKYDKLFDKQVKNWLRRHHLPDSLSKTITDYGAAFCK